MVTLEKLIIYITQETRKLEFEKGKNFSPWTKFDPLTTNISWIYNLSSWDITKYLAYHNS